MHQQRKKIETMHDKDTTPIMAARWWRHRLQGTGLSWLQDTNYNLIDHGLICAFVGEVARGDLEFPSSVWGDDSDT